LALTEIQISGLVWLFEELKKIHPPEFDPAVENPF
jgi:hypothetical protein